MEITKEIIQDAVTNALNDVIKVRNDIDNSDDIVKSFDSELKNNDQDNIIANENNILDQGLSSPAVPVEEPINEEQVPVEEPVVEETTKVEEPVVEETTKVEEPVVEETTKVEEDLPVKELVEEKIDESIDNSGTYNLFGIDINVVKNGDKYSVTLKSKKDDSEKVTEVDSADMNIIFGLVEDFFNDLVMKECDEETSTEQIENTETAPTNEDENETPVNEVTEEASVENVEDEDEDDIFEDDKDEDDEAKKDREILSSLKIKYADGLEAIFAQGLRAKRLALELIKDKVLASTIKELSEKNKENEKILADKKVELENVSLNYLVASKLNSQYDKMHGILSSCVAELKDNYTNGLISEKIVKETAAKYNTILSNVFNTSDSKAIIAAINDMNKLNSYIMSCKKESLQSKAIVSNKKTDTAVNVISTVKQVENKTKPVLTPKNVLNNDGYVDNTPILAGRTYQSEYDEMIAEIIDIGNNI